MRDSTENSNITRTLGRWAQIGDEMDKGFYEGMTEAQTKTPIEAIMNEGGDEFTNMEDILALESI